MTVWVVRVMLWIWLLWFRSFIRSQMFILGLIYLVFSRFLRILRFWFRLWFIALRLLVFWFFIVRKAIVVMSHIST